MTTSVNVNINIVINNKHFDVHQEEMTGAQLKALATIPLANLLFLERHGHGEDQQISDTTVVSLHNGDHFYDMPPGTFGWR